MYSQSKCILNINLPTQRHLHLPVYKTDSLHSIKQQLAQHTGIPVAYQILSYSGYAMLDDAASIEQLTESNSTPIVAICLDIAVSGGVDSIVPLIAPDMSSDECFVERNFTKEGPDYLMISKGINFVAFCRNATCIAFNDIVCIQLEMCKRDHGSCNYAEVMFELPCPACKTEILPSDIKNVVFTKCTVKIKYVIYEESRPMEFEMIAPTDKYVALKDPEKMLKYHFIKFTLK